MTADATPSDGSLVLDLRPFEGRSTVGPTKAPSHLPDARRAFDIPYAQIPWPLGRRIGAKPLTGIMETGNGPAEERALPVRQASPIAVEGRADLELRSLSRTEPR